MDRFNTHFSKEDVQMVKKDMKRYPTSLIMKEMQIKTIMRYYLTPVRIAIIKVSINNKCWRGCGEKGTFLDCCWEYTLVQPLWRTVWRFLKTLRVELPYNPGIPLLGTHQSEKHNLKGYIHPVFTAALSTIADTRKQLKCPLPKECQRSCGPYIQRNITWP